MPHLIIDRLRSVPIIYDDGWCGWVRPGLEAVGDHRRRMTYLAETLEIIGGLIFVVGSILFLPSYSRNLHAFLASCVLFIVGSVVYVVLSTFTLVEAILEKGFQSLEACEASLFMAGSIVFLVGTILYFPEEAHYAHIEWMKTLSFGTYFNLFEAEYEGTLLFIAGSVMLAMAAFANALNRRVLDASASRMLVVSALCNVSGSLLFVLGSVAFLPEVASSSAMILYPIEEIGAWCFVVGSALYVAGGVICLLRTIGESKNKEHTPLVQPVKQGDYAKCDG